MAAAKTIRGSGGFSVVELVVVLGIFTILLSLAVMQFNSYSRKNAIESQTKTLLADLVQVRNDALFSKQRLAVKVTGTTFAAYPSASASGTPTVSKTFSYPVVLDGVPDPLIFNGRGIAEGGAEAAICIEPAGNEGVIDSVVVQATRLQMGKRKNGTDCEIDNIDIK